MDVYNGITVIIPTYNGERYLEHTIQSVFDQTMKPHEVMIVDDKSQDRTLAVAERVAAAASVSVRIVRLPSNSGGPSRPINVGVREARGEYIAVLDQDDVFLPDRLERHAAAFVACPDVDVVFGLCASFSDTTGKPVQNQHSLDLLVDASVPVGHADRPLRRLSGKDALRLLIIRNNYVNGFPAFTFRRSAWEAIGGVDESLTIAGDYNFLCDLARQSDFAYFPELTYLRRDHDASATRDRMRMNLEGARVRERHYHAVPALDKDVVNRQELKYWYEQLSYWVREAGRPVDASMVYLRTLRMFGWDRQVVTRMMKVWPVWLFRKIAKIAPTYSDMTQRPAIQRKPV
jgi:glycosyltransferase involved in cell wall biosynthesis